MPTRQQLLSSGSLTILSENLKQTVLKPTYSLLQLKSYLRHDAYATAETRWPHSQRARFCVKTQQSHRKAVLWQNAIRRPTTGDRYASLHVASVVLQTLTRQRRTPVRSSVDDCADRVCCNRMHPVGSGEWVRRTPYRHSSWWKSLLCRRAEQKLMHKRNPLEVSYIQQYARVTHHTSLATCHGWHVRRLLNWS